MFRYVLPITNVLLTGNDGPWTFRPLYNRIFMRIEIPMPSFDDRSIELSHLPEWRASALMFFAVASSLCQAQYIERRATVPAGGHGDASGTSIGWTLGQSSSASYATPGEVLTAGVQQPEGVLLALNIGVLLDGPYREANELMHDSLRVAGLLPFTEPHSALGFQPVGMSGGESFPSGVLLNEGSDAIVDWVFIELRDALDPSTARSTRSALVQRDGDVVDRDGISALRMTALPGNYHVAVFHRNHLPAMTLAPIALSTGITTVDLTDGSTPTYGTNAQRLRDGKLLLWAGDVTGDGVVKYTGGGNDRDPILQAIGGVVPTATTSGYLTEDVNLDGTVKYTGQDNDRDPVLQSIGGVAPTNVRPQQLP